MNEVNYGLIILDTYAVERILEELEESPETVSREEIEDAYKEVNSAIRKLTELKEKLDKYSEMGEAARRRRLMAYYERFREEEEERERLPMTWMSADEAIKVAIGTRPKAPEKAKKEAREIMEKYGLTEEDAKRLYEALFGGYRHE